MVTKKKRQRKIRFLLYKYTGVNTREGEEFFKLNDNSGTRTKGSEKSLGWKRESLQTKGGALKSFLMGIV